MRRGLFTLQWVAIVALLACLCASARTEPVSSSIKQLTAEAERGDVEAQLSLGLIYYSGEGVPQHLGEAVRWFRRAAEQGNAVAQSNLGVLCLNGEGMRANAFEAFKWFSKAAAQGLAQAQVNLGTLYLEGTGVRRFPQEAARWFRRAADQGDSGGQRPAGSLWQCHWCCDPSARRSAGSLGDRVGPAECQLRPQEPGRPRVGPQLAGREALVGGAAARPGGRSGQRHCPGPGRGRDCAGVLTDMSAPPVARPRLHSTPDCNFCYNESRGN